MEDLYELLDIDPASSGDAVEKAIKQLVREWNPRLSSPNLSRRQEAENMISLLDKAREILLDPARRAEYDRERERRDASQAPTRPTSGTGESVDWLEWAASALKKNNYHEAKFAATQALNSVGPSVEAWRFLYRANMGLRNWRDALIGARQCWKLDPDEPELYLDIGHLHWYLDEHHDALSAFAKAARYPGYGIYAKLPEAFVLTDLHRFDEAIQLLERLRSRQSETVAILDDSLAEILVNASDAIPVCRQGATGQYYYITSQSEIVGMEARVSRAIEIAQNPEIRMAALGVWQHLQSVQKREFYPGFPVLSLLLALTGAFLAVPIGFEAPGAAALLFLSTGVIFLARLGMTRKPRWEINAINWRRQQMLWRR